MLPRIAVTQGVASPSAMPTINIASILQARSMILPANFFANYADALASDPSPLVAQEAAAQHSSRSPTR
jgi:hypothetical protein